MAGLNPASTTAHLYMSWGRPQSWSRERHPLHRVASMTSVHSNMHVNLSWVLQSDFEAEEGCMYLPPVYGLVTCLRCSSSCPGEEKRLPSTWDCAGTSPVCRHLPRPGTEHEENTRWTRADLRLLLPGPCILPRTSLTHTHPTTSRTRLDTHAHLKLKP